MVPSSGTQRRENVCSGHPTRTHRQRQAKSRPPASRSYCCALHGGRELSPVPPWCRPRGSREARRRGPPAGCLQPGAGTSSGGPGTGRNRPHPPPGRSTPCRQRARATQHRTGCAHVFASAWMTGSRNGQCTIACWCGQTRRGWMFIRLMADQSIINNINPRAIPPMIHTSDVFIRM